jgi:hypothetical protein
LVAAARSGLGSAITLRDRRRCPRAPL